jgi:hypothetical protein
MSKERAAKVMQEIFSKGTYEGDLLGINEGRKISDTPRMDDIWGRHVGDDFGFEDHSGHLYLEGQNLERELAETKEQLRLCNVDQFTTAAELAEAVEKEREACAQVVDDFGDEWMCDAHQLAKIIRERGRT